MQSLVVEMSVPSLHSRSRRSASSSDKSGHTQRDMKRDKSADGWAERKKEAPAAQSVGRRMSDVNVRGETETSPWRHLATGGLDPDPCALETSSVQLTASGASAARPPGRSYCTKRRNRPYL